MDKKIYMQLKDYFSEQQNIRMAFLFGSRARERARADSDVDIGVYLEPGYTRRDIYQMWNELEDMLGLKVDLLVLNETTPSLAWTALKGKRLFIRDQSFYIPYMLDISREAEDFQQFLLDWWRWRMKIRGAV
ncbi:type VII toxin-antitoxin system MntA family adenylyltransferase antitoxin [Neomoorella mulderi]|uniref:Nucleotidyltransferase domain protein n=1 Tax=Moorella mulderi DSM 14980 TaxID=1122241 RepID=A0A151AYU9_9FIRM|nr:nucleotidyltransferase domain-containing protein [Moorella mulderi]KYH32740.1 nucleotidyltransferase domain protein [Moorella mulderi DSM 14980]